MVVKKKVGIELSECNNYNTFRQTMETQDDYVKYLHIKKLRTWVDAFFSIFLIINEDTKFIMIR